MTDLSVWDQVVIVVAVVPAVALTAWQYITGAMESDDE